MGDDRLAELRKALFDLRNVRQMQADDLCALDKEIAAMARAVRAHVEADRPKLYAYLDKAGYRRSGDLVFLTPVRPSRTVERHKSDHTVVANIITETREQLVFEPMGARLDRFRKNPIVLYNHDYDGLPVARSLWERVRDADNGNGPELIGNPQFHMDTELSREVWRLVMDGHLCAWELGVLPEKWEKRGEGYYVTAWDVLEYSVVPRPEDIPALREERRQRRVTSPALVKSIMADVEKGEEGNGE